MGLSTSLLAFLFSSTAQSEEKSASDASLRADIKICRSMLRDPDDRIAGCNRAMLLGNSETKTRILMIRSRIQQEEGRWSEAISDADAAARETPGYLPAQNNRCWLRGLADLDLEVGRAACDTALNLTSEATGAKDAAGVWDSAGLLALRQERWIDAWDHFNNAVLLDPKSAHYIYGRGLAALARGLSREAALDLRSGTSSANAYIEIGLTPIAIAKHIDEKSTSGPSSKLTRPVFIETKAPRLEVTADGKLIGAWQLADIYPDNKDVSELVSERASNICLRTTGKVACHSLSKGQTGVYIIKYKGREYLAHFMG